MTKKASPQSTAKKKPKKTAKKAGTAKKAARKAAAAAKKSTSTQKPAASKKSPAAKKTAATRKSAAARKTAAKKNKAPSTKKAAAQSPKEQSSGSSRKLPKASELMKRATHTPAIFKASHRRSGHILLTLEEVRDILKKRAKEEKSESASSPKSPTKAAKKATKAAKKAVPATPAEEASAPEPPARRSRHAAASLDDILGTAPAKNTAASSTGPGKVPRKFKKYHDLLVQLRKEVSQELNLHSSETLKKSQKDDAGDLSISVDAGTDNFDRDFALSLLSSEQEALKEIEAALQRIYKGTYGICEVTGQSIAPERLEAVPFTRFSLEGQRQHESQSRRRVDRPGSFLNDGSGDTITFGDDDGDN